MLCVDVPEDILKAVDSFALIIPLIFEVDRGSLMEEQVAETTAFQDFEKNVLDRVHRNFSFSISRALDVLWCSYSII